MKSLHFKKIFYYLNNICSCVYLEFSNLSPFVENCVFKVLFIYHIFLYSRHLISFHALINLYSLKQNFPNWSTNSMVWSISKELLTIFSQLASSMLLSIFAKLTFFLIDQFPCFDQSLWFDNFFPTYQFPCFDQSL